MNPAEIAIALKALSGLGAAIGATAKQAAQLTTGLTVMGPAIKTAMSVITAPLDAIRGLADSVSQFVALANPVAVQMFTLALRDTMAVIGQMLTPILVGATSYVRQFGDVLAKLLPVIQPLFSAFGQALTGLAGGAAQMLTAAAPFIELITDGLTEIFRLWATGMGFIQGFVAELYSTVAALFGLKSDRFKPDADSRGAAFRQSQVGSVQGFSDALFKKSLEGIFGGGQKKDTPELLDDIKKAIETGRGMVQDIRDKVIEIYEWFVGKKNQIEDGVNKAKDFAGGAADSGMFGVAGLLAKAFVR